MSELPNVVIVIARCSRSHQRFGIRFEEKDHDHWIADWAFAIKETPASREGYHRGEISGVFGFDTTYPGCPHCGAPSMFQCVCGEIACWDSERRAVNCPCCGTTVDLRDQIDSLSAVRDL